MLSRLKFEIAPLVDEILDQLPAKVWTSKTTTFFDPAMGGGQFVNAIEQRLRAAGHTNDNISGRVYACENSKLSVQYAKNKYNLVATLGVGNFLEKEFGMKFDVIVGNPPFDKPKTNGRKVSSGQSLAVDFIKKSCSLLKDDGYISMISPPNYLKPTDSEKPTNKFESTIIDVEVLNIQTKLEDYFPKIGSAIVCFTGKKTYKKTSAIKVNDIDWNLNEIPFIINRSNEELIELKALWNMLYKQDGISLKFKRQFVTTDRTATRIPRLNQFGKTGNLSAHPNHKKLIKNEKIAWLICDTVHHNRLIPFLNSETVKRYLQLIFIEPTVYHNLLSGMKFPEDLDRDDLTSEMVDEYYSR